MEQRLVDLEKSSKSVYWYSYIAFFVWNLFSTWWIYYASGFGVVMAVVFNSFFMAYIFYLYHKIKTSFGLTKGLISLVVLWTAFEYLHLNWDLSYPWLTLGNAFSNSTSLIQWYEYTGALGGSLWVLVVCSVIYAGLSKMIHDGADLKSQIVRMGALALLIIAPIILSIQLIPNKTNDDTINVVVVQPNIDPYTEKFGGMSARDQIERFTELADTQINDETDFVVGPETFIPYNLWLKTLTEDGGYKHLESYIKSKKSQPVLIAGMNGITEYGEGDTASITARTLKNGLVVDYFNSALQIEIGQNPQYYHKSKLVLGVEKMPFPALFKPLQDVIFDLGGTTGSLGTQDTRTVFSNQSNKAIVAPVVCWESVYGEFVGDYINKGANIIFIVTNDGWWEDTPGYKQHLSYARLRAIETRRHIVRCANTGISCFIDPAGDITQPTNWWEPACIKSTVGLNDELTFYTKHGDFIGRILSFVAVLFILYLISFKLRKKA